MNTRALIIFSTLFIVICSVKSIDIKESISLKKAKTNEKYLSGIKHNGKRLETVDGVEIASSYKEYLDLALDDLKDRLKKSEIRSSHFKERIVKRTNLLNDIENEIAKRREYSVELLEKDKLLRKRLIRNTEMKSALLNLADIAGYKLNSLEKLSGNVKEENNTKYDNLIEKQKKYTNLLLMNTLGRDSQKSLNTSSYTLYIDMAYSEVDQILIKDKQALVDIIRKLKSNKIKLSELEQLKIKVNSSLNRLNEFESKLVTMINHDTQIEKTINKLENQIDSNLMSLNNNFIIQTNQNQVQQSYNLNSKN